MTRTLYEIWPAKGSAPLISFEVEDDALAARIAAALTTLDALGALPPGLVPLEKVK